jgi:hypothetical protein
MKKIIVFTCFFVSVAALAQRKDSILAEITKLQFTPTEIGKPDGEPVSQKIGANGGKLVSSDNKVELKIPPGALSSETMISIQPATNTGKGGVGKSYSFEPSGIQFQQPVQLVLHYTDEELDGDSPQWMAISYQDEKGVWYRLRKVSLDTSAKTITGDINHFSLWALGWTFVFEPDKNAIKVSNHEVVFAYAKPIGKELPGDREDMINDLYGSDFSKPNIWSVNGIVGGDNAVGTIKGDILYARYTAPASVPDQNPVEVMLEIKGGTIGMGPQESFIKKCKITVYDNRYEVDMVANIAAGAGSVLGSLWLFDVGSFVVSMEGKKTRIVNIKNQKEYFNYVGNCQVELLHEGNGMIQINGIRDLKVTPAKLPEQPFSTVEIAFVPAKTDFSNLKLTCPNRHGGTITMTTATSTAMFAAMPALPMYIKFIAKEGEQTIYEVGKEKSSDIFMRFTVKQIKDD